MTFPLLTMMPPKVPPLSPPPTLLMPEMPNDVKPTKKSVKVKIRLVHSPLSANPPLKYVDHGK
jgi:hypothetical protein